tara:strand:- start:33095 stop:34195 length:1101 start_codon:yes stop_codon:yes gene_type:complete
MSKIPVKVCIIGPVAPPNGGMALQGQLLKKLLQSDDIEVDYLAVNFPLKPKFLNHCRGLRAFLRLCVYIKYLWQATKTRPVLHILANSGWSWHLFSAPAIIIGQLRKCKVIINYRGGGADKFFKRQAKFIFPVLRRADTIIVPSVYLQQIFEKYNFKADVVPNIIAQSPIIQKNKSNLQGEPFIFVVTRNLEEIYGIHTIIDAMKLLQEDYSNFILKIAGSGPCLKMLEAQAKNLGLSDKIVFCGRLNRTQMQALYHNADIMINASTVDNMPNALLEALSYGVPIISTRVGGIPYMVEHMKTAILVEPQNAKAIKIALMQVIQDSVLRARLSENGLKSAKQYTWANIGPQWKQYYALGCNRETSHG